MPGGRYPTLRRGRADCVRGVAVDVAAAILARLAAYEGPRYRLVGMVVATKTGPNSRLRLDRARRHKSTMELSALRQAARLAQESRDGVSHVAAAARPSRHA